MHKGQLKVTVAMQNGQVVLKMKLREDRQHARLRGNSERLDFDLLFMTSIM